MRSIDRAQDTVHSYLGDPEAFDAAHKAARAQNKIKPAVLADGQAADPYVLPDHKNNPGCRGFLCP
ncbi:MAG TPA: hypothetical protein DDX54_06415 [Rhodospirillaceae bacterium]|nr:hypothetical protein [Alphaproteobacteria bacterium]HBH27016.1 hypothetical protein [Rhodospirillaceae bacterium]